MTSKAFVSLLHRQIWQRLPRSLRRTALFHATSIAAPRPTPNATPAFPLIVAGPLKTASGLGQSARLSHDALKRAGLPVLGIDLTNLLRQVEDVPNFAFEDGSNHQGPGTLLLNVNAPTAPLAMMQLGSKLIANKRIAACWAWELPLVPPDWSHGIPFVHEIWTPSTFTADAISPIAQGRAVAVIPYPVALGRTQPKRAPRTSTDPFTVLTIFNVASSFARKNPCAAIEAFRLGLGDDPKTHLIVKLANPSSYPGSLDIIEQAVSGAANITIIDRTFNALEIDLLYEKADALISLHRSEGFGLTLAEAMLHGLPVVATNWSGNTDFLTPQTGIPIPYTLIPARDPQGSYDHPEMTWADADIPAAANALTRLRDDPAFANRLGHNAACTALDTWSPDRYVAAVRAQLGL